MATPAGSADYKIKVRVICARAYHALFMHNLLIRPTREELEEFGEPEFVILNAGDQPADPHPRRQLFDQPHARSRAGSDGDPGNQLCR